MSLAVDKQRHRYRRSSQLGQRRINAVDLLGKDSKEYLIDRKSIEFEKALESLRYFVIRFAVLSI